ncbi:MAG: transposon-encoded TnpW family protein [Blautia sp.]|nr:transposon-encoded TnpW family protein [Blautia sp.]MCM1559150.1 transposon-encoded TnpW family protein [Butyrivibrio sp.]
MSKSNELDSNIQTNTTGRLTPCLQKKIDKTTYLVEVHFNDKSTQSVEDKLRRVILHDLEHGKQGRTGKNNGK